MTEAREIVIRVVLEYPPDCGPTASVAVSADEPLLYKVPEAATLLRVGESTLNELIARNELESVKIGNSRRITRAGLETYVRRLAERGDDAA